MTTEEAREIHENAVKAVDLLTDVAAGLPPEKRESVHRKQVALCEDYWDILNPETADQPHLGLETDGETDDNLDDDLADLTEELENDLIAEEQRVDYRGAISLCRKALQERAGDDEEFLPAIYREAKSVVDTYNIVCNGEPEAVESRVLVPVRVHALSHNRAEAVVKLLVGNEPSMKIEIETLAIKPIHSGEGLPVQQDPPAASPPPLKVPPSGPLPSRPPAPETPSVVVVDRRRPAIEIVEGPPEPSEDEGTPVVFKERAASTMIMEESPPAAETPGPIPSADLPEEDAPPNEEPPETEVVDERTAPIPASPATPAVVEWPELIATCEAKPLAVALKHLCTVADKGTGNLLLSNCLISPCETGLRLSATDHDAGLICEVPATVEKTGAYCVRPKAVLDALPKKGTVSLHGTGKGNLGVLTVKGGPLTAEIEAHPGEDFPTLDFYTTPEGVSQAGTLTDEAEAVAKVLLKLAEFWSYDHTRLSINGPFLDRQKDQIMLAASNGHLLVKEDLEAGPTEDPWHAIVHRAVAAPLKACLKDGPISSIAAYKKDKDIVRVVFKGGNWLLSVRAIVESFPETARVIPSKSEEYNWGFLMDKAAGIAGLTPFTKMKTKLDLVAVWREGQTWRIKKATNTQIMFGEIPITGCFGEVPIPPEPEIEPDATKEQRERQQEQHKKAVAMAGHVGLDTGYVIDVLKVMPEGSIRFQFPGNDYGPVRIEHKSGKGPLAVVMPVRM